MAQATKILLIQCDGKLPSVALMRLSAHHKAQGHEVDFRYCHTIHTARKSRGLFDLDYSRVYASLIFTKTRPIALELQNQWPNITLGGTGWDYTTTVEQCGVSSLTQDYSLYPAFNQSLGYTQRGCRLKCPFCVVPLKEGKVRAEQTINEIWRGHSYPRELILLDNDFFGQPDWRQLISTIRDGQFKVSFTQGINARLLDDESAEALASVSYYDDRMKRRCLHTAWDNLRDEERLFRNLNALKRYGVRPDHITVYLLIRYWKNETVADWIYRHQRLTEWGARAYPMPYIRDRESLGFQRWCVRRIDKFIPWDKFVQANYRSENL